MTIIQGLLLLAYGVVGVLVVGTLSAQASYSQLHGGDEQPDPSIPPIAMLPSISHTGEELEAIRQYYRSHPGGMKP